MASRRCRALSSRSASGAKSRVTSDSTPKIASPVHSDGFRWTKWLLSCSAIAISRYASAKREVHVVGETDDGLVGHAAGGIELAT